MQKDDSYILLKPIRYKFKRRQTMAAGPRRQCQIVLLDPSKYSSSNEGWKNNGMVGFVAMSSWTWSACVAWNFCTVFNFNLRQYKIYWKYIDLYYIDRKIVPRTVYQSNFM